MDSEAQSPFKSHCNEQAKHSLLLFTVAMDLLSVFFALCCLGHLVCSAVPRTFAVGQGYLMLAYEVLCAIPWLLVLHVRILFCDRQDDRSQVRGILTSFREQGQKLNQDVGNTKAAIQGISFPRHTIVSLLAVGF